MTATCSGLGPNEGTTVSTADTPPNLIRECAALDCNAEVYHLVVSPCSIDDRLVKLGKGDPLS